MHLLSEHNLTLGSCHATISGLRFFYTAALGQDKTSILVPPIKKATHLPEILSAEELKRLFVAVRNPKHRAMLM